MTNTEEWRAIPGYEGFYEVSSLGRVKSLARVIELSNGRLQTIKESIRSLPKSGNGYLSIILYRLGHEKTWHVHSLVALAFIGPQPPGTEVRHGTGGPLDNSVENLCYGTFQEQYLDKVRDGTALFGDKAPSAKLTAEKVLLARKLVKAGPRGTLQRLAEEWGVHNSALSMAVSGKRWAHL